MTDFGPLESGTPLAPVTAHDLRRVWSLIQGMTGQLEQKGITEGLGFDARLISQHCEPGADVIAVFFRAALLQHFFQAGLLDDWREANELSDPVFRVAAIFPMEQGVQGFDPAAFIERLRHPEP